MGIAVGSLSSALPLALRQAEIYQVPQENHGPSTLLPVGKTDALIKEENTFGR